ncbi:MAG: hypothetical protein V7677_15055, partial [Motiliproteus sp.]
MRKIIILMIPIFLFCRSSFAFDKIKFIVPDFEPYTFEKEGEIKGIGAAAIKEIMDKLNVSYALELAPNYGRAFQQVKDGGNDG